MASSTPRTRTPRGDVPPGERAPLLRSDGSARPRSAVWLSVALIVAGVMVLAVGAAPRFWKHAPEALVNGALYRPEAAAEEAAVLEAEVLRADGGSAPVAARNADAKAREAEGAVTDAMTDAERLVVAGGMSSAEQLVVGDDPDPMVKELEALEAKRDEYSVEARRARQRARQARRSDRREER